MQKVMLWCMMYITERETVKTRTKVQKKKLKISKKVLDKVETLWYYIKAVSEEADRTLKIKQ